MTPQYSTQKLDERAAFALQANKDYIDRIQDAARARNHQRKKLGIPAVAFCGHGRAGKDTAAEFLCKRHKLVYPGSASWMILPVIAHMTGGEPSRVWEERHQNRPFWIAANHAIRRHNIVLLVQLCLGAGDVVPGPRCKRELEAAIRTEWIDLAVWVESSRVPPDVTVEFTKDDCHVIVENHGTIEEFHTRLARLGSAIYRG